MDQIQIVRAAIAASLQDPELAPKSKTAMGNRCLALHRLAGLPPGAGTPADAAPGVAWALENPARAFERMKEYSPATRAGLASLCRALFKRAPALARRLPDQEASWKTYHSNVAKGIQGQREQNEATRAYKDAYVPWKKVVERARSLPRGSQGRLLLAFLTMIPPLRRNYGAVRIVRSGGSRREEEHAREDHLVLRDSSSSELVICTHKTRKHTPEIRVPIPAALYAEIATVLRRDPHRTWLFGPMSQERYGRWLADLTCVCFGRAMSQNTFRHLYLSEGVDLHQATVAEKKEIAQRMGHGLEQQMLYVYKSDGAKAESGDSAAPAQGVDATEDLKPPRRPRAKEAFHCPTCQKAFRDAYNLARHESKASCAGKELLECPEGCGARLKTRKAVSKHLASEGDHSCGFDDYDADGGPQAAPIRCRASFACPSLARRHRNSAHRGETQGLFRRCPCGQRIRTRSQASTHEACVAPVPGN